MYSLLRPLLFRLDPHTAHELASFAMGALERSAGLRRLVGRELPVAGRVRAMGLEFPSRVGVAGGFDKDGRCPRALAALGFGFLELGTVTALPQAANPRPNLFRLPADRALVNRLGFPNLGAEHLARALARARPGLAVPVGVSVGKSRAVDVGDEGAVVADYVASVRAVREAADFLVINVSSPNTPNLRAMQRAGAARALLSAIMAERGERPVLLKVAPDLDDAGFDALLDVVGEVGLAGVVATNTTISRAGLRTEAAVVEAIGAGGLSGPPVFARALHMVARARERLGGAATIVGVGGVSSVDAARAMLAAGADLLQVYTAFVYEGPRFPLRLARELAR